MHVERKLALTFETLLLRGDSRVTLEDDTLGQEFLLSSTAANFRESSLGFVDEASAEGTQADLNESTVEEDLGADVEVGNVLGEMRHEHQITRSVVLVVKSKEVDLAKHRARPNDTIAVSEEIVAESLDEVRDFGNLAARSDG